MNGITANLRDHREAVWAQLSKELGGQFVDRKGWAQDYVRVEYDNWVVTLDFELHAGYRSECVHTRFRAPVLRTPFRFRVFQQELIHSVARILGMQDIEIGDGDFDRMFVVQGTDTERVREIFQDDALRRLMLQEPELEIELDTPEHPHVESGLECDELSLEVPGKVEDGTRLRNLFDAFGHILHGLQKMGLAHCNCRIADQGPRNG